VETNNKKVELIYREMMAKKTGEERLLMGFSMFDFSAKILLSSIKKNSPPEKLKEKLFLRLYRNDFTTEQLDKILKHL
jgi:hypothetical protein